MTSVAPSIAVAAAPARKQDVKAAARQFEAVFLRQVIGEMRKAKLGDDLFGSSSTDTMRELADARTAEALAQRGAFGIAALVERQLEGKR